MLLFPLLLACTLVQTPSSRSAPVPPGRNVPTSAKTAPTAPPAEMGTYRVPYRLTETQHLMVRAKINGHGPYNFIVDTGAPALYLSKAVAAQLHIARNAQGVGTLERLEIEGGAILPNQRAMIEDPMQLTGMNAMGLASTRLDGVFGYTLLARFRITADLSQSHMTWTLLDTHPAFPTPLAAPGGKPMTPPQDLQQMQQLAQAATKMFARPATAVQARGFFGMEFAPTSEDGKSGSINGKVKTTGAVVARILPGSPAEAAGLRSGDRITGVRIMGVKTPEPTMQDVATTADVRQQTAECIGGDRVQFRLWRGAQKLLLTVQAGTGGL